MKKFLSTLITLSIVFSSVASFSALDMTIKNNPVVQEFEDGKVFNPSGSVSLNINDGTYSVTGNGGEIIEDPKDSSNHVIRLFCEIPTAQELATAVESGADAQEYVATNAKTSEGAYITFGNNILQTNTVSFDFYSGDLESKDVNLRMNSNASNSWNTVFRKKLDKAYFIQGYTTISEISLDENSWYTVSITFDKESERVIYMFGKKGERLEEKAEITAATEFKNFFNGEKINAFQVMSLTAGSREIHLDNIKIATYVPMYQAINAAANANLVASELELYSRIGLFDEGNYDSLIVTDGLYAELMGQDFETDAQMQEAYNELLIEYSQYTDGKTVYYDWDFDNSDAELKDSVSSGKMNLWSGNGAVAYTLATNPSDSNDYVARLDLSAATGSETLTDISKVKSNLSNADYVVFDYEVYRAVSDDEIAAGNVGNLYWNTHIGGNRVHNFGIRPDGTMYNWDNNGTDYQIITNYGADFAKNLLNRWINVRNIARISENIMETYILVEGEYKLFTKIKYNFDFSSANTADAHFTKINTQFGSINKGSAYFDDITIYSYRTLFEAINAADSAKSVEMILKNYKEANLAEITDEIDILTTSELSVLSTELMQRCFTSDVEVTAAVEQLIELSKIKAAAAEESADMFIYSETTQTQEKKDTLTDMSVVINTDSVNADSGVLVAGSYKNGTMIDVAFNTYSGSLSKYTKLDMNGVSLDVTDADTLKVFLFSDMSKLIPLTEAITKVYEISVETNFYPNWTKKAVTFTLDDGIASADTQIINILREGGFKATFSLLSNGLDYSTEEKKAALLSLYSGFEIANHTKYHPYPYVTAAYGEGTVQPADDDGIVLYNSNGTTLADEANYIKCVDVGEEELEEIFGKGSVVSFVWPGPGSSVWADTDDDGKADTKYSFDNLAEHVVNKYAMSRAGEVNDPTFSLPESWTNWAFNASETLNVEGKSNVYDRATAFSNLSLTDSDTLRWLCIGCHPYQYVNDTENKLSQFIAATDLLKNKPETYWYAGNREIYDYTEALKKLVVTETSVTNNSDMTLYIKVNGKKKMIAPGEKIGR